MSGVDHSSCSVTGQGHPSRLRGRIVAITRLDQDQQAKARYPSTVDAGGSNGPHARHLLLLISSARADEIQVADAMIDAVITKKGEAKGAYQGYAVLDLRPTARIGK